MQRLFILLSVIFLGLSTHADILRNPPKRQPSRPTVQPRADGFTCQYVTAKTKRKIEVTGFSEDAEKLPAKYEKMIWPGQAVALEAGKKKADIIFDLTVFHVGGSGFAGKNVKVEGVASNQEMKINFATGASAGQANGTLTITKGGEKVVAGPVICNLIN